jgi:hypothetical protein
MDYVLAEGYRLYTSGYDFHGKNAIGKQQWQKEFHRATQTHVFDLFPEF